jgi:hypothetical protein
MPKTSLIRLKPGDPILYEDGSTLTIEHIELVPNGMYDPQLIALIYAKRSNGNIISATSNRFEPDPTHDYEEFYPSVFMNKLMS